MDKLSMKTPNLTNEHIEKIAELFPNCVFEMEDEDGNIVNKIDFDLLKTELGKQTGEGIEERYRLDRPGKKRSILKANTPITKTLRPVKEDSEDWDNTGNLYIEGDNFEILKILQESYLGKIKMIYIDPPYNTGNDFVYNDDFSEDAEDYKEKTEQDAEGYIMMKNTESNGRFHSDRLSMMYERLKVARDFLQDDGVIFMSIDDNEQTNLKKICDEIFGEANFVACLPTIRNLKGKNDCVGFANIHEYMLVYTKNILKENIGGLHLSNEQISTYDKKDDYGERKMGASLRRTGADAARERRPNCFYPIYVSENGEIIKVEPFEGAIEVWPLSDGKEMSWLREKEKVRKEFYNLVVIETNNGKQIYKKQRLNIDGEQRTSKLKSVLQNPKYDSGNGTALMKELFNGRVFDNPKPLQLIEDILEIGFNSKEGIILDFFSGSATTAHACMQLNAEDGGNRKFIMIQLPEMCSPDSEAYKQGYSNICEIGKERIRRAAKKIKDETGADIDYGFRVYKVDESCMKNVYYHPNDTKQADLGLFTSNIKDDRTVEDLLTQVILNLGLTLDLPIEEKKIKNNKIFYVAGNSLVACFDENIDFSIIEEIAKDQPLKMVLRDSSFKSDADRINFENAMKELSKDTIIKVI